jgi:3-oxoacyl-[acyl-carrier-protein] synthase-3
MGVTEEWIIEQTGVLTRHVSDLSQEDMGARAAAQALGNGPPPDLIINASAVPRQVIPDTSAFIQQAMGLKGIASFSVHATCLSFAVARQAAAGLISAHAYRRVLIVSPDLGTRGRNYDEPESAALFGDGAAAVVVEPTAQGESSALLSFQMSTWPEWAHLTEVRGGGTRLHPQDPETRPEDNLFHMDGPTVYKVALRHWALVFKRVLREAGVKQEDIDLLVPHQASGRAVSAATRFGFNMERVVSTIAEEGNCVAASMPLALSRACTDGRIQRGDLVLLGGTGAGMSVLACLLRW